MGEAIGPNFSRTESCPQPLPCSGSIYMDDTYLWAEPLGFLQSQVDQEKEALATEELYINGDKTECVCSHQALDAEISVQGQTVPVQGPSHAIKVLGATFTMGSSVSVLIASVQQKARAVLATNKATFRGDGTLAQKAKMSDVLIRPTALWVVVLGRPTPHSCSRRTHFSPESCATVVTMEGGLLPGRGTLTRQKGEENWKEPQVRHGINYVFWVLLVLSHLGTIAFAQPPLDLNPNDAEAIISAFLNNATEQR